MTCDRTSAFRRWGRVVVGVLVIAFVVLPWPLISWGRAQRSGSAPAVLEVVWQHPGGRNTIGAYSFTVDNHTYRGEDQRTSNLRRGVRTWTADDLLGMHVCYDPTRPGEEFALAPARYRCGDPDIITTDGGW